MSHTKESIQALIDTRDEAVERAILAIYARQTDSEKAAHSTQVNNSIGFSGVDAPLLTSFAERLLGKGERYNVSAGPRHLTAGQMSYARKKVRKYWKQLLEIAKSRLSAEQHRSSATAAQLAIDC